MKAIQGGKEIPLNAQEDELLKKLPACPGYFDTPERDQYKRLGKILIDSKLLKSRHLPTLEVMAAEFAQFEMAVKAIKRKNKAKAMSGYIQTFSNGTTNISPEVTLKQKAEKQIFICLKAFGLDPRSEKDLGEQTDPNQLSLLNQLLGKKSS